MELYRITHRNGHGLYRGLAEKIGMPMTESESHPMPRSDSVFMSNAKPFLEFDTLSNSLRYAFCSKQQLRRWMYNDRWLRECESLGGEVRVYQVPDKFVIVGTTQAAFVKGKEKLVCKMKLSEFIK